MVIKRNKKSPILLLFKNIRYIKPSCSISIAQNIVGTISQREYTGARAASEFISDAGAVCNMASESKA